MAFPTIPTVAAGRVLVVNQLDTTGTRTFPNLSSLTKNSGDLLIAIIVAYQTSTGTNAAFSSWGGGFTEFHDSATGSTMAMGAAYKWSDGTETGTFSVTQAGTITGDASMILLSIPGAHLSTPPEAGSRASGTTGAADPASFNPSGWDSEDTLWISVVGSGCTNISGSWTGTGTTAPSNYTSRVDTNASDTSVIGDCEAAVAFRQLAASSDDVGTAGVDTSNARNGAFVIAVRPGVVIVSGEADLAGAGSLQASATVVRHATADLAGVGAFAAAATVDNAVNAIGDLAGTGVLASESKVTVHPTADLAAVGAVAADGTAIVHGSANLEGAGALSAAGQVTRHARSDLSGLGSFAAAASTVVHPAFDLAGTAVFEADATSVGNTVLGEADLAGTGAFAGVGTVVVHPTLPLAGNALFGSQSSLRVHAQGALAGVGAFAAAATGPEPIGPNWPLRSGNQWETHTATHWAPDDADDWPASSSTVWS